MAAPLPTRFRLSRANRLRRPSSFAATRERGKRVVNGCLIVNWLRTPGGGITRLGVVTGRRIGPAVTRSRARRLLREVYRRNQHSVAGPLDLILVARQSIVGKRLAEVERDFLTALRRNALLENRD